MDAPVASSLPLRFAVIHDAAGLARWQIAALERLREGGFEPALRLVLDPREASPTLDPAGEARASASGSRRMTEALARVPAARTAAALHAARLDFALYFSAAPASTELLDVARHGVWAPAHEEDERRSGRPPALWEVLSGHPTTEVALCRLGPTPADAQVLARSTLKTEPTYARNLASLERACATLPLRACRALAINSEPERRKSPSPGPGIGVPTALPRIAHAARRLVTQAVETASRVVLQEDWGVGIIDAPIASFLQRSGVCRPDRWLPRPQAGECYTDPFGLVHEGRTWLFFEHFARDVDRGVLVGCELRADGTITSPERVIDPGVHVSYPHVFAHEGAVYCIPETSHANEVALYRADGLPGPWRRIKALLPGLKGFDSSLLFHEGRFWLWSATTEGGPVNELHLWHAPTLEGPWTAHPMNPLKVDVRGSRPGGTPFLADGKVYRPAQDGSIRYGGRLVIHEVTQLSPDRYEEHVVASVEPDPDGPYPLGLHTLSAVGSFTLIDGKRSKLASAYDLRRRARRLAALVQRRPAS